MSSIFICNVLHLNFNLKVFIPFHFLYAKFQMNTKNWPVKKLHHREVKSSDYWTQWMMFSVKMACTIRLQKSHSTLRNLWNIKWIRIRANDSIHSTVLTMHRFVHTILSVVQITTPTTTVDQTFRESFSFQFYSDANL